MSSKTTLIERKKLQWAQEREELKAMKFKCTFGNSLQYQERKIMDLEKNFPNIENGSKASDENGVDICAECADTSGYDSDNGKKIGSDKLWKSQNSVNTENEDASKRMLWKERDCNDVYFPAIENGPKLSYTPPWLKRSLSYGLDLNQNELDFPADKTFLRGQNVIMEPEDLLEREQKKAKALELQEGIKKQLEEKEQRRREEERRRIAYEKHLEEIEKRLLETERRRLEDESRLLKIKQDKENRKSELMLRALSDAREGAKEAKVRSKNRGANGENAMGMGNIEKPPRSDVKTVIGKTNTRSTSLTNADYMTDFGSGCDEKVDKSTQTNSEKQMIEWKAGKKEKERPKWGVNQSEVRYRKQSEKDLLRRLGTKTAGNGGGTTTKAGAAFGEGEKRGTKSGEDGDKFGKCHPAFECECGKHFLPGGEDRSFLTMRDLTSMLAAMKAERRRRNTEKFDSDEEDVKCPENRR